MDKESIKDIYTQTINQTEGHEVFKEQKTFRAPSLINMPHGEWIPVLNDINGIQRVLATSANFIDSVMTTIADDAEDTVKFVEEQLDKINLCITSQEILADNLAILSGEYGDNVVIESLGEEDFGGSFIYEDGVFLPLYTGDKEVKLQVESVIGNGYEGNEHALRDETTFWSDIVTPSADYMVDKDDTTYFEYSRITSPKDGMIRPILFNDYHEDLSCVITLSSEELFSQITIASETDSLILSSVETSLDNEEWFTELVSTNEMSNTNARERDNAYAFGTGRIDIEPCYYVRLTFTNAKYDSSILAYEEEVEE